MHQPCPKTWKKCHPHTCTDTPLGPPRVVPKPTQGPLPHNVLLLVDEHEVGNDPKQSVKRNGGTTLRRRYVWYHDCVNLATMNVPDIPIVIKLDDQIGDPTKSNFKWEGYMFDVPAGDIAVRVAIVAGADEAGDSALTGNAGKGGAAADRPVGFAATYADPKIPIGPVVQVRRDDQYRLLGQSMNVPNQKNKVWRCAYYITKETPQQPSGIQPLRFAAEEEQHVERDPLSTQYDEMMDKNIDETAVIVPGAEPWGGQIFNSLDFSTVTDETPDDSNLGSGDGAQTGDDAQPQTG